MNLPSLPGGPRTRKVLKFFGYVLVGLVTFVYALHFTFDYDRVKDKGIEALSSRYDVTVGSVERGWLPGDFSLKSVQLRSRPSKPGEVPKVIFIDRLDVDLGVLALITGKMVVDIDAKVGPGHISGTITAGKDRLNVAISSSNLPLSDVPGLAGVIGMPMGGKGNVSLALDLPNGNWVDATARLAIDCPNCTIGGEGAFFKPRNPGRNASFVGEGVAVPMMTITSLHAVWRIANKKIKTEVFTFDSPHITVALDFEGSMKKSLKDATVDNGCLRYRGTDALKKLDEKFYNALELTGGPLGPDDQRHLKLVGTLGTFKAKGLLCGEAAGGGSGTGSDVAGEGRPARSRPSLGNVPDASKDGATGAGTTGTVEPGTNPGAPVDAAPTPKIDDVRIAPVDETGSANGELKGDPGADREKAAIEGATADELRKNGDPNGNGDPPPPPPPEPHPTDADSVQLDPDGTGTQPPPPPGTEDVNTYPAPVPPENE